MINDYTHYKLHQLRELELNRTLNRLPSKTWKPTAERFSLNRNRARGIFHNLFGRLYYKNK
jgi:hypothetical protein